MPHVWDKREPTPIVSVFFLFDDFERFAVDGECNEDQENHTLDELLRCGVIPHHDQSIVEHSVHQSADNNIDEAYLGSSGDRQSSQHQ